MVWSVTEICEVCGFRFSIIGRHPQKTIQRLRNRYGGEFCEICRDAKDRGAYLFTCGGCARLVSGSARDVVDLLNVVGHRFCRPCLTAFRGVFDVRNPAVAALVGLRGSTTWNTRRRKRRSGRDADWRDYANHVRRQSKVTWRQGVHLFNAREFPIGASGTPGAHQLDHIVPVRFCWDHEVPLAAAGAAANLQVIPWFLNAIRTRHFRLERMVNYPASGEELISRIDP